MVGENGRVTGFSSIEITGGEAIAGSDMLLSARITCEPPCDLTGSAIDFIDPSGALLGIAKVVGIDDKFTNLTEELVIKAPMTVGETTWRAVLASHEADGIVYQGTSFPFAVTVRPHPVYMTVWDVPYSLDAGDRTTIRVGVKCGAGCSLGGTDVIVTDEAGDEIARAKAGELPWEGTEALHVAEVEVVAPKHDGAYNWQAIVLSAGDAIVHDEGHRAFKLQVMPKPQVSVTIEAVSKETGAPISNANVVMHPYRARTDASGSASLKAAKGDYTIMVSKPKFDPMSTNIVLNEDFYSKVELVDEEPEFNPDDNY